MLARGRFELGTGLPDQQGLVRQFRYSGRDNVGEVGVDDGEGHTRRWAPDRHLGELAALGLAILLWMYLDNQITEQHDDRLDFVEEALA